MSLSKPFRLQMLPVLCFEEVLHQMYPIDLICMSMCSEKTKKRMSTVKVAECYDLEIDGLTTVLTITFRSGGTFKWCIQNETVRYAAQSVYTMKYPHFPQYEKLEPIVINGTVELETFKIDAADTFYSLAYVTGFGYEEEELLFVRLLSAFPCPLKDLLLPRGPEEWIYECILDMDALKNCEHVSIICAVGNTFVGVMDFMEVTRKATVSYADFYIFPYRDTPFDYNKLVNLDELKVIGVGSQANGLLLEQNNEHLELELCSVAPTTLATFFKRWTNGEYRRLKTFRMQIHAFWNYYFSVPDELQLHDTPFFQDETHLVKFSSNLYLDITPANTGRRNLFQHPMQCRTALLRNCHGEWGTLVMTPHTLHFVVWSYPLPPVEVPRGRRLTKVEHYPLFPVTPLESKIFRDDEEARKDFEGIMDFQTFLFIDTPMA